MFCVVRDKDDIETTMYPMLFYDFFTKEGQKFLEDALLNRIKKRLENLKKAYETKASYLDFDGIEPFDQYHTIEDTGYYYSASFKESTKKENLYRFFSTIIPDKPQVFCTFHLSSIHSLSNLYKKIAPMEFELRNLYSEIQSKLIFYAEDVI